MSAFIGNVEAVCPTCKQPIDSQSVVGQTLRQARQTVKRVAAYLRKAYPFAKIKTTDPLEWEKV